MVYRFCKWFKSSYISSEGLLQIFDTVLKLDWNNENLISRWKPVPLNHQDSISCVPLRFTYLFKWKCFFFKASSLFFQMNIAASHHKFWLNFFYSVPRSLTPVSGTPKLASYRTDDSFVECYKKLILKNLYNIY